MFVTFFELTKPASRLAKPTCTTETELMTNLKYLYQNLYYNKYT